MRRLATSVAVELQSVSFMLHSELHAVEYLPSKHNLRSSEVVPIRFIRANKVGRDDMLLLGFDAFLLTQTIGQEIAVGKIIHGDHGATLKVKTSTFVRDAQQRIKQIAELLSASSPPELILKRHCAECEFQRRCRQNALDTDDLSLLSGMSKVERAQHRSRGIFSVRQLSYTFRPRRTRKRAKNCTRPHSFALQALAIRENTIYIHGTPHLPECKNHVYLDIEGLPDRDFYYLIGALIVSEEGETSLSFWADTKSDEASFSNGWRKSYQSFPTSVYSILAPMTYLQSSASLQGYEKKLGSNMRRSSKDQSTCFHSFIHMSIFPRIQTI